LDRKLIVTPEYQNKGIGRKLIIEIHNLFSSTQRYILVTGFKSIKNIKLYESLGYKPGSVIRNLAWYQKRPV